MSGSGPGLREPIGSDGVEELYERARALRPEARASFLAEACRGDTRLEAELGSLLAHAEPAEAFFAELVLTMVSPTVGHRVGHYRLIGSLGSGGMGTVYRAHDIRLNREVALKFLPPHLSAQPEARERLLLEAHAAAALEHPNVCSIHEIGATTDGRPFIAMACYEGETLKERFGRGALPPAEAVATAVQVARGLGAAHARGIIHRDVKPGNVMLGADGTVRLLDFGLAKMADVTLTGPGVTPGTVAYMSPEQARGDPVDHRTDLWSLGVVLYEMLAGERPFRGGNDRAVIQAILHEDPELLRKRTPEVPRPLARIVERLLQKEPEARYASADELLADLARPADLVAAPTTSGERSREGKGRRWIVPAAALAVLGLGLGIMLARSRAGAPSTIDPDLLAIAPFDARTPQLEPWSEGVVDVLSRSLDGAGALRTVPPSVSLKGWTGRADRASAEALGRRTGAGLVLYGALEGRGPDSVGLRAALLDVGSGQAPQDIEVAGDTLRMDGLVDSLAVALLRELGRTRPVGAVRRSPLGARSLPALKAFLRGEQFYRRNLWDSALAQYDRAIALDSTFAFAYRRLGMVLGWYSGAAEKFRPPDEILRRGVSGSNHGLAPRDSLLIVVDTLANAVIYDLWGGHQPHANHFANRRRLLATLAEARRRYPGDPEVWYTVGEVWNHAQDPAVATDRDALSAFDHAIALDSAFAPAYIHTPGLAIAVDMGDPERARRYLSAYLRLNPTDDNAVPLRLAAELLDPARAGLPETRRFIDTARAAVLWTVGIEYLSNWPDSAETAVELWRSLAFGQPNFAGTPSFLGDSLFRRRVLAFELTRRGHLKEAYHLHPVFGTTRREQWLDPYERLALLGAVPVDTAAAVFRRLLEGDAPESATGLVPAFAWWFAQGDTLSLGQLASRADSIARRDTANPAVNVLRHYAADAARAYVTLARGDSAAALRAFTSLPDSACGPWLLSCRSRKLIEARLLTAAGQDQRAAGVLDRWGELEPLAVLERARLAERLGDREAAIKSYRFVAAIWRHADPELQGYVAEARGGLARLTGAPEGRSRQ